MTVPLVVCVWEREREGGGGGDTRPSWQPQKRMVIGGKKEKMKLPMREKLDMENMVGNASGNEQAWSEHLWSHNIIEKGLGCTCFSSSSFNLSVRNGVSGPELGTTRLIYQMNWKTIFTVCHELKPGGLSSKVRDEVLLSMPCSWYDYKGDDDLSRNFYILCIELLQLAQNCEAIIWKFCCLIDYI